ncbi:cell division protein ZapA [Membranicola marinus]|uniref:Cell division protein ZapA n=1 Tax=Membranihabitans marinus TaxID=1227546 RepID=A0A953HTV4_9BACT|nr:cell division protein ZapA [Membranihabitans marinus]MBY5958225.1 cell division protein ZapA [Membranihabitans marinus]
MSDRDTKSLKVVIGGVNIPVKVHESEADQIHDISAKINTTLKDIQIRYPDKKLEEALAMTVLSLMVQKETETQVFPGEDELMDSFDQVDDLLDKLLQ